jgi:hypothetical protein
MAVIHHTTLTPGKLDLLSAWLPAQPWYRGWAPSLAKCGGFRLDDPAGQVGIEFMFVTDVSGDIPVTYHVPLTYRGAPLDGAVQALIGTAEHGVLGTRWIYDGTRDPVLTGQLLELLRGSAAPQAQSISDTPDPSVTAYFDGTGIRPAAPTFSGTDLAAEPGLTVRIARELYPADDQTLAPSPSCGRVTAGWHAPDGSECRGAVFTVFR